MSIRRTIILLTVPLFLGLALINGALLYFQEKAEMAGVISDYRQGLLPLVVPLTLMRHHARRLQVSYLLQQAYLQPHPKELRLLNHV